MSATARCAKALVVIGDLLKAYITIYAYHSAFLLTVFNFFKNYMKLFL